MTLVRVRGAGEVTLPAEARDRLRLHEGDYLEVELIGNALMMKPAVAVDRAQGWDQVMAIVDRPKWQGPGPEPTDDELLEEAVEEIHAMRAEHDQSGSR